MKPWMYKPWSHIESRIMPVTESGCWIWMGCLNTAGYGHASWQGKVYRVHRLVYEHYKGPIPEGLHLDHLCKVTSCCNPDHLEAVTPCENLRRGNSRGAHALRTNICKYGHPYTEETTRITLNGYRQCRVCLNAWARGYWAKKKTLADKPEA
jgi:hypothetical protein